MTAEQGERDLWDSWQLFIRFAILERVAIPKVFKINMTDSSLHPGAKVSGDSLEPTTRTVWDNKAALVALIDQF